MQSKITIAIQRKGRLYENSKKPINQNLVLIFQQMESVFWLDLQI
jgi:ATP phosphoribosyltransferase